MFEFKLTQFAPIINCTFGYVDPLSFKYVELRSYSDYTNDIDFNTSIPIASDDLQTYANCSLLNGTYATVYISIDVLPGIFDS